MSVLWVDGRLHASHFTRAFSWAFVNILVHSYLTKKYLMLAPMLSFIFVLYVWLFRVVDPLDHHQGRLTDDS